MKIRSITCFLNPNLPPGETRLAQGGSFAQAARPEFEAAGYEVQSLRLATPSFARPDFSLDAHRAADMTAMLEQQAARHGFDYVSVGSALPEFPASYAAASEILATTRNVFVTGQMTMPMGGVSVQAVRGCAEVIHKAARLSPDGFANLRFAALANVPPGTPFLPAAYASQDMRSLSFALAIESADLAVEAFQGAASLEAGRRDLVTSVENHAAELERVANHLCERFQVDFKGIDFTLAPFPRVWTSVGTVLELMGVPAAGLHGSLAAAAILADTLDRAEYYRTGFNGLMFPVLEDAVLADRAAEGLLGVKDLLLWSTVCGTGLDCVPLPGDTSVEQLFAVLLDVAVLSQRLDKPLTARLMPIPGKQAGDPTGFDFTFFSNSRILPLDAEPLGGLLASSSHFDVQPRHRGAL